MNELEPFVNGFGGTVVEVGSRDGHDAAAMKRIFQADRVVTVEANPLCFNRIEKLYPEFENWNLAIGDHDGRTLFWQVSDDLPPETVGRSSLLYAPDYGTIASQIEVDMLTMDSFTDLAGIDEIEVLKLDVEGATYEFLIGFTKIRMTRILHIESEHRMFWSNQHLYSDTVELLVASGYEQVYFQPVFTDQSDTIWIRR